MTNALADLYNRLKNSTQYSKIRSADTGYIDDNGNVANNPVEGLEDNYIWVRIDGERGETRAKNLTVSSTDADNPVEVGYNWRTKEWEVIRVHPTRGPERWGKAAATKSLPPLIGEVLNLVLPGRKIKDLRARLSAVGGLTITVETGTYIDDTGVTRAFAQTDLLMVAPATTGNSAYAVVWLDRTDGTLDQTLGTEQPIAKSLLQSADWEAITETLTSTQKPLWAIPLTEGQTSFTTLDDWVDLRGIGDGGAALGVSTADFNALESRVDDAEADIAALTAGGITSSGWVSLGQTLTYSSADDPTFTATCAGVDLTSILSVGMRIRVSQSTGGTKYFILTKIAFSTNTTLTLYGGTDYDLNNETISTPYFSVVKAPHGFPLDPAKWTHEVSDTSSRTQSSPVNGTWYNLGSVTIAIPIGSWRTYYQVCVGVIDGSSSVWTAYTTLSTANNSESDVDLTTYQDGQSVVRFFKTVFREKNLTLTSKTSYYLNTKVDVNNLDNIYNLNDQCKLIIRAVCAYL